MYDPLTCLHEAAHHVVQLVLTGRGGHVTVIPNGELTGKCENRSVKPVQELIIALAGIVAESKIGVHDPVGARYDGAQINRLLDEHGLDIDRAIALSRTVVNANWERILALAQQLARRGALHGSEAARIALESRARHVSALGYN